MSEESIELRNGIALPAVGFGTWHIDDNDVEPILAEAFERGYRLIDTASLYGNEVGIGRALKACDLRRHEYQITTKVWNSDQGYDETMRAIEESLKRLQLDYIDHYLIHWPCPALGKFQESWRALEALFEEGIVNSIGVSNFNQSHLEQLATTANIMPMLNQIECHLGFQQTDLRLYCESIGIALQAWRPLGGGKLFTHPLIATLSHRYSKSPAQIILRYLYQLGVATIPKTVSSERMEENHSIFDFRLFKNEMIELSALDDPENGRLSHDPDYFIGEEYNELINAD